MDTRDFLAQVARHVRIEGVYVQKDRDAEIDGTASSAFWTQDEGKAENLPESQDYEQADAALAYANTINGMDSSFAQSVQKTCAKGKVLTTKEAALVAPILSMHLRAEEDAAFQSAYKGSKAIDKPAGFELNLRGVRVVQKRTILVRGHFVRNIVKFATEDGNILTWWASKMPDVQVGDVLARFSGRIKKSFDAEGNVIPDVYQGITQTLVRNCTLVRKVA